MISEVWNTYFGTNAFETKVLKQSLTMLSDPLSQILLKCFCGDDIRVMEVAKDIHFDDLVRELQGKYGKYLIVTYEVCMLGLLESISERFSHVGRRGRPHNFGLAVCVGHRY